MLKIGHISKSYGSQEVLRDVNITFPDSGLFAIVGKSGSGKTTLLNIIASLDKADSGDVELDGVKYSELSPKQLAEIRKNKLSFVFQDSFLLDELPVSGNIRLVKVLSPRQVKDDGQTEEIIASLGIEKVKDKPANQLSGGERQRVAIARCLVKGCNVILADEPTGNLDKSNSENIYKILKELSKDYLVIMVTHDLDGAAYADRVIDINEVNGCNLDFTRPEKQQIEMRPEQSQDGGKKRGGLWQKARFGTVLCLKKQKLFIPAMIVFTLLMAVVLIFSDLAFINPHNAEYNSYMSYGVQTVYYDLSELGGEWFFGDPVEQVAEYQKKYGKLDVQQYTGIMSSCYIYYDAESVDYGMTSSYPAGREKISVNQIIIDDSIADGEVIISPSVAESMATKEGVDGDTQRLTGKNIVISNDYSQYSVTWAIGGVEDAAAAETIPFDNYIKMSRQTNAMAADYRLYLEDDGLCRVHDSYYNSAEIASYVSYSGSSALTQGSYPAADNEIAVSTREYYDEISVGSTITFCGEEYTVTGKINGLSSTNIFYMTEARFEKVASESAYSFTRGQSGIIVQLNDRSQFASLAKKIFNSTDNPTASYIASTAYTGDVFELVNTLYNLRILAVLLGAVVLVLSVILSCYIYSNCFKSLKREMAVLLSQGASKEDIRDILNLPVAGMFIVAFILSLVLFFVAVPLIDGYIAKAMEVTVTLISCNFWAVLVTAAVFIAAYAASYLFSRRKTNKISIVDMLYNRK